MPNYCSYSMKVKSGKEENIKEFLEIMRADYNYNEEGVNVCNTRHFFRIFEAEPQQIAEGKENKDLEIGKDDDGKFYMIIDGYCAWSIYMCMFSGEGTYYYCKANAEHGDKSMGVHIEEISKELKLDIEIFSEETGLEFMEHYIIEEGDLVLEEEFDYQELYDEETDEYTPIGGIDWTFTI